MTWEGEVDGDRVDGTHVGELVVKCVEVAVGIDVGGRNVGWRKWPA